jgi:flagellar protein FlbD
MIEVEKMNNQKMFLNPDLIATIEVTPDTVITLERGEKLLVRTKADTIIERIIEFRRKIAQALPEIVKNSK